MGFLEKCAGPRTDTHCDVRAPYPSPRWLAAAGLLAFSLFALSGCLNTPANQSIDPAFALGIPDHSAFGNTPCVTCHEVDRPPPTIQAGTGIPMPHGDGRDCGECHVAGGASWREFTTFSHSPTPETCSDCHLSAQPTTLVNRMLHTYPGVGDCVACHAASAGVAWTGGTYAHQPIPGTCVECHAVDRPSGVVNGFSHDAGGTGDCAACHHSVGVTWADGFFTHSPAPARCSDCHAGDRPLGVVGNPPFDHAAHNGAGLGDCKSCHMVLSATQRDWTGGTFSHSPVPGTCIDCHAAARPVGPAGNPAFDHANGGMGDCKSCHTVTVANPTEADWAGGSYSHVPTPAACITCHAGDRPAGPVGNPAFDHAIAGMGDCKSCHTVTVAHPVQANWAGGNFSHVPAPTTCIECHINQRPVVLTASGFDHSKNGTGDCVDCHHDAGVSWSATTFDHNQLSPDTRCDSCHAAQRPPAPLNVAWAGHPNNPNQFVHAVVATLDCKGCHADAGGAWTPGTYAHVPNPGQCNVCHVNQRPTAVVNGFSHSAGGMGDCVSCHAVMSPTKTDWTGGSFTHTNAITACAPCHTADRPVGPVGPVPQFNHANGGLGDCISCHAMQSATQTDWSGGSFNHVPKPATCAGCHSPEKPAAAVRISAQSTDGRTYQNDYLHNLIAGDCVACHIVRSATQTDWTGGDYNHSPVPATCVACHAITRPGAGQSAFNHTQPGLADCNTCHSFPGQRWTGASAVPSIVTLTPPTGKSAWGNFTAAHPTIDSAKSGLTCATCHGTNTSAKIIGYDHAFPVIGVKCVYCHYTAQTETSVKVTTKSHESTGPNKDCNVSGCHRPKLPTWNATTAKFTGGSWGEP